MAKDMIILICVLLAALVAVRANTPEYVKIQVCTPEIEKAVEEEGYLNRLRKKQQRACDEGSLDCDELRQYVWQVQSCISELTH